MHKKKQQELPTCNFVLLLSKASMMLMTCLCDFIHIYTTVPQVFPAPNFILPYHIFRIDSNFQNSVGFGVFVGLLGVLWLWGVQGCFPKPACPTSSSKLLLVGTRISLSPRRLQAPNACITGSDSSHAVWKNWTPSVCSWLYIWIRMRGICTTRSQTYPTEQVLLKVH